MVEIGQISLVAAFILVVYVTIVGFAGGVLNGRDLVASARWGFYSVVPLLLIATAALIYAFVNNDFSVAYVAENSNLAMPRIYAWVAFYSGNAGSLLYIAVAFSIMASICLKVITKKLPYTAPYALGVMSMVLLFFLAVILFLANPLEKLTVIPADGQGINPLLIHFGMFIHPPFQMLGLISVALPYSVAVGALLAGRGGRDEWVDQGRFWGMVSWLILTTGLLLGSWWAYTILGWGGYWAWDPVENSALMPWLAMTAFVHSIMVQKRRRMFRMWNIILVAIAFTLAEMGMFINRGGPVPSVHSFAQSTMGWLFLGFMGLTLVASLVAFVWRLDTLKSEGRLDSMLSRESAFLTQNVLFLAVAFITLWGTIYPVFSKAASDVVVTVGQPFFDRVNGPILLFIVFLMGVGPLMPWRRANPLVVVKILAYPMVGAAISVVVLWVFGVRHPVALLAIGVCVISVFGIGHEWVRGVRSRHHKGQGYVLAFGRLLAANRPRYGGYVVHLGISMLALGAIGSSFYDVQRDFNMGIGQTEHLGRYSFTYTELLEDSFPDRQEQTARFQVSQAGRGIGTMDARRTFYLDHRVAATRAAIRSTPIEDFYIVPSEFNSDGRAVFRVYVNPMVWWMWLAGAFFIVGTLFAIWPRLRSQDKQIPVLRNYDSSIQL